MSDENRKETRAGNTEGLTEKLWSGETERRKCVQEDREQRFQSGELRK